VFLDYLSFPPVWSAPSASIRHNAACVPDPIDEQAQAVAPDESSSVTEGRPLRSLASAGASKNDDWNTQGACDLRQPPGTDLSSRSHFCTCWNVTPICSPAESETFRR
jgi:hypothetical protein